MIRPAVRADSNILTEISFASKKYWHYPEVYFEIWETELTVSAEYIEANEVFVYDSDDGIAGYYSLVELLETQAINSIEIAAGLWLEHMFIIPGKIGQGIGRQLFNHCVTHSASQKYSKLRILADPYAQPFYLKMGCQYIKEFPSSIQGRTTPYLEYLLKH